MQREAGHPRDGADLADVPAGDLLRVLGEEVAGPAQHGGTLGVRAAPPTRAGRIAAEAAAPATSSGPARPVRPSSAPVAGSTIAASPAEPGRHCPSMKMWPLQAAASRSVLMERALGRSPGWKGYLVPLR